MLLAAMNLQGLSMNVIDLNSVRDAKRSADPYDFILGSSFLQANALDDLRRDFPNIVKPGYLTVDEVDLHGRFKTLIDELEGPELTEELSRKFGQDLHRYPAPDHDHEEVATEVRGHPHRWPLEGHDDAGLHE